MSKVQVPYMQYTNGKIHHKAISMRGLRNRPHLNKLVKYLFSLYLQLCMKYKLIIYINYYIHYTQQCPATYPANQLILCESKIETKY